MWGRYHQDGASTFFNNSDRWSVARRPSDVGVSTGSASAADAAATSTDEPIDPYYQELQIGSAESSEFVLTRPFVLASSDDTDRELTSIMIARNDPGSYGELEEIVMPRSGDGASSNAVDSPVQANRRMVTDPEVAEYQNFVGRNGSRVRFGNILILPVQDSLVYLRPIYAAEEGSSRFTLQRVVVASGDDVGFGETVEDAMTDLLGGPDDTAGTEGETEPAGGTDTTTTTTVPDDAEGRSATELLARADELFTEADERLSEGDLAGYDELVTEAVTLVRQANRLLSGGDGAGSTTTTAPAG
jgi:hypothetical protein